MSEEFTLTVISHDGTERRITATGWMTIDYKLSVHRGREVVAEFAPGLWAGLVNEAHRKPDSPMKALAAARNALGEIRDAFASSLTLDPRQLRDIAERGLRDSEDYL